MPIESSGVPSNFGGSYFGHAHWKEISYKSHREYTDPKTQKLYQKDLISLIDTSVTIQYRGIESHPVYVSIHGLRSWLTSVGCIAISPLYMVATIVYHVFRMLIIPLYLSYKSIEACCNKKKGEESAWSQIKIIPWEMGISLWVIVSTPICGLGWILGHIYSVIDISRLYYGDSLNARKLTAYAEYLWNRTIPIVEGIWLIEVQTWFQPRNGAFPFYLSGCNQPIGYHDIKTNTSYLYVKDSDPYYPPKQPTSWQSCWPCFAQKA